MSRQRSFWTFTALALTLVIGWSAPLQAADGTYDKECTPMCTEEEIAGVLFGPLRAVAPVLPRRLQIPIEFPSGAADIPVNYYEQLDKIGNVMLLGRFKNLHLKIEGHTDDIGHREKNQKLSEERAESVKRYLVERFQIDPKRLQIEGWGERRSRDTNETDEGRRKNRRVELVHMYRLP